MAEVEECFRCGIAWAKPRFPEDIYCPGYKLFSEVPGRFEVCWMAAQGYVGGRSINVQGIGCRFCGSLLCARLLFPQT